MCRGHWRTTVNPCTHLIGIESTSERWEARFLNTHTAARVETGYPSNCPLPHAFPMSEPLDVTGGAGGDDVTHDAVAFEALEKDFQEVRG